MSADILTKCQEPNVKQSHVMFAARLSGSQIKPYFSTLIKTGLLEMVTEGEVKYYRTTQKGRDFLAKLAELNALLPTVDSSEVAKQ